LWEDVRDLTNTKEIHLEQGRGNVGTQPMLPRLFLFGGISVSNSILALGCQTGNSTLRRFCGSLRLFMMMKGKCTGVRVIDRVTKEAQKYFAKVIF